MICISIEIHEQAKWLEHIITCNLCDDNGVNCEVRSMYMQTNMVFQYGLTL